jgi:spore germination protein YaaH
VVSGGFGWWANDSQIEQAVQASSVVSDINMLLWSYDDTTRPLCTYDNGDYNRNGQWGDCLAETDAPWTTPKFERQITNLRTAGIKVFGVFSDLLADKSGQLAGYIEDATSRRELVEKVANWTEVAELDGVDLYWLSMRHIAEGPERERASSSWVSFVRELSRELHSRSLLLSVTLPISPAAKGSPGSPSGLFPVFALSSISPHVDRVRLQPAEDLVQPGPLASNAWTTEVTESAIRLAGRQSASKFWIGSPQYGRVWPKRSGTSWSVTDTCPVGWVPEFTSRPMTLPTVSQHIQEQGATPVWDEAASEWRFTYWSDVRGTVSGRAITCYAELEVWYSDTSSAVARVTSVTSLGAAGLMTWDLGVVSADFYTTMAALSASLAIPEVSAVLTAPSTAGKGSRIRISASFLSDGTPMAKQRAELWWTPTKAGKPTRIAVARTNARGVADFSVRIAKSGWWLARVTDASGETHSTDLVRVVAK